MYQEYAEKVKEVIGKMDVEKMSIEEMRNLLALAWQIENNERVLVYLRMQPQGIGTCCCTTE